MRELRSAVNDRPMTVKMRVSFENTDTFYEILDLINRHSIDLLSLHGRTVKDMYHGAVKYDLIAEAVKRVHCPVLANRHLRKCSKAFTDRLLAGQMHILSQVKA